MLKPHKVCRFINDKKYADIENNKLSPFAFYRYKKTNKKFLLKLLPKILLHKIFKIKNDEISMFAIDILENNKIKEIAKYRKLNAIGKGDLIVSNIENIEFNSIVGKEKLKLEDYKKCNKVCFNNNCVECKSCFYHCMIKPNINKMRDDFKVMTKLAKISELELF